MQLKCSFLSESENEKRSDAFDSRYAFIAYNGFFRVLGKKMRLRVKWCDLVLHLKSISSCCVELSFESNLRRHSVTPKSDGHPVKLRHIDFLSHTFDEFFILLRTNERKKIRR